MTISIVLLLALAVAPSLSKIREDQLLQNTTLELKSKILEAQSLALSPPTPTDANSASVKAYGIKIYNDADSKLNYQIHRLKSDNAAQSLPNYESRIVDNVKLVSTSPANSLTEGIFIWFTIGYNPTVNIAFGNTPSSYQTYDSNPNVILSLISGTDVNRTITINKATGAVNAT